MDRFLQTPCRRTAPRQPESRQGQTAGRPAAGVDTALRDMALALHLTQRLKKQILEDRTAPLACAAS